MIPFDGPAPRTVLVLPVRSTIGDPEVERALEATLGGELRRRGYYPVPLEAGWALLEERGLPRDGRFDPAAVGPQLEGLGIDAFVTIRVEQWNAMWAPTLHHLEHDLGYRVWDARSGALLWELRSRDRWDWEAEEAVHFDSSLDAYLGNAPRREFSPYRDVLDVARAIHRRALSHLPAGER